MRGSRRVPVEEFITGPKQNVLEPDELIAAVWMPAATGPQQFAKVGTRNAMVIAVCSFAVALNDGRVGTCIGSAGPTPIRAREAEAFASGLSIARRTRTAARFGELVAAAASPIDDVRGTAAYRRHALSVLAKRTLDVGLEGTMRLTCTINGEPREVDGLWEGESLLYVLRERLAAAGLQERVRAGRVRVVLGVPGRRARLLVPGRRGAGRGARGGHRRRARATRTRCTRCRRRSSRPVRSSAGSARRG